MDHFISSGYASYLNHHADIPAGSDPGKVVADHPILGSDLHAVPMQRFSFKHGVVEDAGRRIVREFDDVALGAPGDVVGVRHQLIQPKQIAGLMSRLHSEFGLTFVNAALLDDQTTFFSQAQLSAIDVGPVRGAARAKHDTNGRDVVEGYLTFSDSYTGKRTAQVGMAHTRAVCENTARAAIREARKANCGQTIRHVGDVEAKLVGWDKAIDRAFADWRRFGEFAQVAAQTPISIGDAKGLIEVLTPAKGDEVGSRLTAKRELILSLFENGIATSGETVWDLFNGVTEYANWHAGTRNADNVAQARQNRLENLLFNGLGDWVAQAETELRQYVSLVA